MAKNLYVGNMAFSTTEDQLREAFSQYGTVTKVQLIMDRETGRPRGFAFIEMSDGGDQAIAGLNGTQLDGRSLTVNEAKPREGGAGAVAVVAAGTVAAVVAAAVVVVTAEVAEVAEVAVAVIEFGYA